ncbi:MAG: vitamin B12-dependent ribonucleotide reductase [Victivallaceae bacterium]|nr:vitamin B12-dependent ribonucleotide reductase [Victivallaceae bacterium]
MKQEIKTVEKFNFVEKRASLQLADGSYKFDKKIKAPDFWSERAVTIAADKYLFGDMEDGIAELVSRVVSHISQMNRDNIGTDDEFYCDLSNILLDQRAAFNSPVWFNVGVGPTLGVKGSAHNFYWDRDIDEILPCDDTYQHPQGAACFIQSVDDTMESIMRLAASEAMLFKYGSGTGTDLSTIRSSRERLSNGGIPSGPLSFMRIYDQIAMVVKSGGKTRRAAKMQSLKSAHPDIIEFIECKWREELKAKALVAAGYSSGLDGEAIQSAFYQNSNISVRVSDEFMRAVEMHETYDTIAVTTGEQIDKLNASKVLMQIAEATWKCGDPGLQFDDTINYWHTCKNSGRINASNPCSEYMFLDDSACNLASLNLIKYIDDRDNFKVLDFARDIRTLIRSMDALVDGCSYPTAQIAENSHRFRPLGLGYCNLGGLLMALGVPYDSDAGRAIASEITSYMTAIAYYESAMIAKSVGAFDGFDHNREPMLEVVSAHWKHSKELASVGRLIDGMTIDDAWSNAYADGRIHGYRNAQVTVLAPTGTISLFMDAETGGIEPFLGLISYKKLVGGGTLTKASQLVERGLRKLGYGGEMLESILEFIKDNNHVLTDLVKHEHQKVFETSFGAQSLPWKAHIDMMAAVQPFLSGAISKTVNMPNDAIADDIYNAYHYAWRSGLKSIAIYRDGSKATQPESSKKDDHVVDTNKKIESDHIPDAEKMVEPKPMTSEMLEKMAMDFDSVDLQVFDTLRELVSTSGRVRLPQTRNSLTHKFDIAGHEGYFTVGLYDNGQPGELFITISKEGSTIAGLLGVVGTLFSMAVQSGVPLSRICDKFIYSKFEPSGWTANQEIGYAHSIVDYIFRWLKMRFVDAPIETKEEPMPNKETVKIVIKNSEVATGEPCKNCGGSTVQSGACWVCTQCGETTGCG